MPDLLEERFGLVLALRRKEELRSWDFEEKVTSPKWGNLKPGTCEFSLKANSLREAHILLEELGLNHQIAHIVNAVEPLAKVEFLNICHFCCLLEIKNRSFLTYFGL